MSHILLPELGSLLELALVWFEIQTTQHYQKRSVPQLSCTPYQPPWGHFVLQKYILTFADYLCRAAGFSLYLGFDDESP
jgi:hypothetical protein